MTKKHDPNAHNFPPQHQQPHGLESKMEPKPDVEKEEISGCNRLTGKVAIITGGDSGIGRAVAVAYAKEGANVCIIYLTSHEDAKETKRMVEEKGMKCLAIAGDIGDKTFCENIVIQVVEKFSKLDILVNNAAIQQPVNSITEITPEQLERTFKTNIFSFFYMTQAAVPHLKEGSVIINTASIVAYKGHQNLLDYSATKGAIVTFTRSLSLHLKDKKIRVNAVAPGPIWTPLIVSTFPPEKVEKFGSNTSMERAGQPSEVAPCYVFLASSESSYISGQVIHPNGGEVVNG